MIILTTIKYFFKRIYFTLELFNDEEGNYKEKIIYVYMLLMLVLVL